jgi:hypothetical protein
MSAEEATLSLRFRLRALPGAITLILGAAAVAPAQPNPNPPKYRYLVVDYHKPEPGKTGDYVQMEREYWKPVHQDRVNNGKITSWKLYAVSFPNGEGQEYDFVTVTEFASFADLENQYAGTDFRKVLGDTKAAEIGTRTGAVQKLRRSDTLAILLSTENWSKAANNAVAVHYLLALPGKTSDLMKAQREYYLPQNEDLIKARQAASWATTGVRYPQQYDRPYSHVSFNGYETLAQMEARTPQELRDKWNAKFKETTVLLNYSRKRVKGELWRLVDQTAAR